MPVPQSSCSGADSLFNGMILADNYRQTAAWWHPAGGAKMGLYTPVLPGCAVIFSVIHTLLASPRAIRYGALYGLSGAISSGYGL